MVLDSADKKQFETTSLESVINNPKCTQCGSKTVLITDPSSGERVCEYCGQVACEEDMQASLELLASSPKISHKLRTSVASLAHHDRGLATRIGLMNKASSTSSFSNSNSRCLSKISPKLLGSLFTKKYPLPA
jgi:transcription initiation factor TFIIIB Brf1 subunit/transcription initiation factor TFIIB